MSSKYQIFVSSTYIDLKEQRDLVIKAVLEMGHIPVGMEMFSAADEEQWSIIKRQIDQSDYYVVILANRYGSVTEEGVSYTEMEYDYALSKGIPIMGFVLNEESAWPSQHSETSPEKISSLQNFKTKVKQKHVSFWRNTDDLYGRCSIALMKAFTAHPREGWIRSSQYTDPKLSAELARLSSENAELREKLEDLDSEEKEKHFQEVTENMKILNENIRTIYIWYSDADEYKKEKDATLTSIFLCLAPEMLIEKSIDEMSRYAAQLLCGIEPVDFRYEFPIPSNIVKSWMADFSTLGLVKPSEKKKPVSDKKEYWTLSEKGKEMLTVARRKNLKMPLKKRKVKALNK